MKTKKSNKKLILSKLTIARLNDSELDTVRGGADITFTLYSSLPCIMATQLTELFCD